MVTQAGKYLTGDAAFAVDRYGVIVLWNEAAETALGYTESDALGEHCWNLLCGQDMCDNAYCGKRCPPRDMGFRDELINQFPVSFSTALEGRKRFSVSCLMMHGEPGVDWLLHMCKPSNKRRKLRSGQGARMLSGRSQSGHLTRRENEVLLLLKKGKSTAQIGESMSISQATVRNHVQHLLKKLNVHNRLEAITKGIHPDLN